MISPAMSRLLPKFSIIRSIEEMREFRAGCHNTGLAFVPTMGSLHEGHLSLVKLAKRHSARVMVSIFVNPLQFGPSEDFATYPREVEQDLERLAPLGVDAVFLPEARTLFPKGKTSETSVKVQGLSQELCGVSRPQFFEGVTTILSIFFNIINPNLVVLGEKDLQQLRCVEQMVKELYYPIKILSAPILRCDDGLALSSRNQYLTQEERELAPFLFQILQKTAKAVRSGERDFVQLSETAIKALTGQGFRPDYFEIRDRESLLAPKEKDADVAILVAAWLGRTRLIDNIQVEL